MKELKTGKTGLDICVEECLKSGRAVIIDGLVLVLNVCSLSSTVPVDWTSECVTLCTKVKGLGVSVLYSFRDVCLLSVAGKVYDKVLIKKIREGTEGMIYDDQGEV